MKRARLTIEDFFNLPSAEIFNPDAFKPVYYVSIDSRNIKKNSLFIAFKGENFDGHNFISEAVKKGASAVVVDKKKFGEIPELDLPVITVEDTVKALGDIANTWRKKLDTKIIALTGSVGKTFTKEILAVMLGEKFRVNKTEANNNNHIGVPLTLLSTNEKHDVLVLEIGTNHFGEVEYSSKIAQPDFAFITNIGDSHLEFLKNRKGVLKEKSVLLDETINNGGLVFINNDDKLLKKQGKKYSKKVTYGFENSPDVKGKIVKYSKEGKPLVRIKTKNKKIETELPVPGEHIAANFLAATAVSLKLGLRKSEIINAASKLKSSDKRLNIKSFDNLTLIDDTYNANPQSVKSAVELLGSLNSRKRKIAIMGDMFELGEKGKKLHKDLCRVFKKQKIDSVFTIGPLMKHLTKELKENKIKSRHFKSREKLNEYLENANFDDAMILVKGSRGMKMEEFANKIEGNAIR